VHHGRETAILEFGNNWSMYIFWWQFEQVIERFWSGMDTISRNCHRMLAENTTSVASKILDGYEF
jgi:hypothetical protein